MDTCGPAHYASEKLGRKHHDTSLLREMPKKVEIKNPKQIAMKNKRPATQGVCPNCGTKVFRMGKA